MDSNEDRDRLLVKLFEHTLSDDAHVRAAAYMALKNFEPMDGVISCLLNGLGDEDMGVRRSAGAALISFGYLNREKKYSYLLYSLDNI